MDFGNMVIIGGAEDKSGGCEILRHILGRLRGPDRPLVLLTAATELPEEVGKEYRQVFSGLGFDNVRQVDVKVRRDAESDENVALISGSCCVFFTGGDQLKITSLLGGTRLHQAIREAHAEGVLLVGTSAGASCVCSTMVVSGLEDDAPRKCTIKMAPGLDIIGGVLIDQHFSQRGRIGRLMNAVAQNPGILGLGIDEDTALSSFSGQGAAFRVIGSGAVTIIDGREIRFTNVSELAPDENLAITGMRVHILPRGYGYDVATHATTAGETAAGTPQGTDESKAGLEAGQSQSGGFNENHR